MKIPTTQELQKQLSVSLGTSNGLEVVVTQDIFFSVFGIDMIIPKGFSSDGISVPIFRKYSFHPNVIFAGMVHDYFFRTRMVSKVVADGIFYVLLRDKNNLFVSKLLYYGVRYLGGYAWWKNGKNLEKFPEAKNSLKAYICT